MVIKLYQTGVTTREIRDIIEQMYVSHHTIVLPQFIISQKATQENVATFHERILESQLLCFIS